jgi:5-methyltetrahydropteroyltriglutamate--homocysteine methyltransferase
MKEAGIDHIPSNDSSLYDHVLDMAVAVGAVPRRYRSVSDPLARYFAMARGHQGHEDGLDVPALEMTKWFDTNYHYLVPELEIDQVFELEPSKVLREFDEASELGIRTRPVLLGPVTFLLLSKLASGSPGDASTLDLLEGLLPIYQQLLSLLADRNADWVQIDEPCLVTDLDGRAKDACRRAFARLATTAKRPKVVVATYFGALEDNLALVADSTLDALHVDLVRAPDQLDAVLGALRPAMALSLGIVDGRNVWKTDLSASHQLVRCAVRLLGRDRVWVAPSCSLLHVPVDLSEERKLDPELRDWMAFAVQKIAEVRALADAAEQDAPEAELFQQAARTLAGRRASPRTRDPKVRGRAAAVSPDMLKRTSPFPERSARQRPRFRLPLLPTTTIGSFPQTREVRAARAEFRRGKMTAEEYRAYVRDTTRQCIRQQETLGLDVLVHGEFERTDMVEYFGEQLAGFAFTQNGWVQSYGSRCVKPPVLFGDVTRKHAMTVEWATFAQSQTDRPMKGMLTGPVTILQWSFVRDDQPRSETCRQIALALRDEVVDLEAAGISIIQVDEPAIREGLPLRRKGWKSYLRWAVDAFRVATGAVSDETQIHTHMCYAEFGDILDAVAEMDADVLSIETSRSRMELLADFARFHYPNQIGPGVYDIHSPRVPTRDEMVDLLERAAWVLPVEQLWVNPDCGLKTRGWTEVEAALANMVQAARVARKRLGRLVR